MEILRAGIFGWFSRNRRSVDSVILRRKRAIPVRRATVALDSAGWTNHTSSMAYTVHQAKTHLPRLLKEAEAGKEVIVMRGTKPIAKIVPIEQPSSGKRTLCGGNLPCHLRRTATPAPWRPL